MTDEIELSVQGEVAFVRLRRPDTGNTLRGTMFEALRKIALRLGDTPPRFVVLTGEGSDFCAGLSRQTDDALFQLFDPLVRSRDVHRAAEVVTRLRSPFEMLSRLPCPVIAAIEGRCHGVGLELALAADLRVGGEGSTYALDEGRRSILTGFGGLPRLAVALGTFTAANLVLTGATLTLDEAVDLGLVQRRAPAGGALNAALDLVHEMKRVGSATRLQTLLTVRALHQKLSTDLQELETQSAARSWTSGEYRTAVKGEGESA